MTSKKNPTINDFTLIEIDFWNRPIWQYKETIHRVCLVDVLVTLDEIKEKLPILINKLNKGIIKFYIIYDEEPSNSINLTELPEKDIVINNKLF